MEQTPSDDTDVTLEKIVVLALSKLQKRKKSKKQRVVGVPRKKVVEFLLANYPWVDGDVESQVMTALLSCIKTGIVCALENHKFLLLGANANSMISKCVTRVSHGPKCCCVTMLKCLLKNFPRTCCVVKKPEIAVKKAKKTQKGKCGSGTGKPKSPGSPRRKDKKENRVEKKTEKGCAQKAQNMIGTSNSAISICRQSNSKCNYCLEIHSMPKLRRLCMTCYPVGKLISVPSDKFSPRDEVPPHVANIS